MKLTHRSRRTFALCLGAISVGSIALAARWVGGGGGDAGDVPTLSAPGGDAEPLPVVEVELTTESSTVDVGLRRVGIRPESLAAAGVSSPSLGTLLEGADDWFVANPSALPNADAAYADARVTRDQLLRKVQSGLATDQEVIDLQQAEAAFDAAELDRTAALDQLFQAASAELSAAQVATLSQIRANARWKFPEHFLVEERDQATWVELRDALANERIAPRFEEEPDAGCQSFLSTMRARPAVSEAEANSDTYLATLQASWDASLD